MSDWEAYVLRWRGKQSGPFSAKEINRKLDEHEIGMAHEINCQGRWMTVEEFLRVVNTGVKAPGPATAPNNLATAATRPVGDQPGANTTPLPRRSAPAAPAPAPPEMSAPDPVAMSPRRRYIFATLAILLGFTGIHNFYARHWLTGIIQLLVSLASFMLGFGIIAPWLWAMAEAVLVRKDGREMEMS